MTGQAIATTADPLTVGFTVAGIVAVCVGVFMWLRATKHRQDAEDAEREEQEQAALADAVAKQIATPYGMPTCTVCRTGAATEAIPVIARSWLDEVTALKSLYALSPRYVVKDGEGEEYERKLCRPCKRIVSQKWEEVLAEKRAEMQRLGSRIALELSQLQGQVMLAWARSAHENSRAMLQQEFRTAIDAPVQRQLPAPITVTATDDGQHDAPIALPAMSTRRARDGEVDSGPASGSASGGSQ